MLYREAGQFKTSYKADSQIFPILQDRISMAILIAIAAIGAMLMGAGITIGVAGLIAYLMMDDNEL